MTDEPTTVLSRDDWTVQAVVAQHGSGSETAAAIALLSLHDAALRARVAELERENDAETERLRLRSEMLAGTSHANAVRAVEAEAQVATLRKALGQIQAMADADAADPDVLRGWLNSMGDIAQDALAATDEGAGEEG